MPAHLHLFYDCEALAKGCQVLLQLSLHCAHLILSKALGLQFRLAFRSCGLQLH